MSDDVRDQVEDVHAHEGIRTATSLQDAANSNESLGGYAAVNGLTEDPEITALAQKYYNERQISGATGSAVSDWLRAEQDIRQRRASPDNESHPRR